MISKRSFLLEILQTFSQLESVYLCQFSKTLSQFIPLGVKHLALNLKPTQRPADEVLTELAEYALTQF